MLLHILLVSSYTVGKQSFSCSMTVMIAIHCYNAALEGLRAVFVALHHVRMCEHEVTSLEEHITMLCQQ